MALIPKYGALSAEISQVLAGSAGIATSRGVSPGPECEAAEAADLSRLQS
jgi:hypothetical protein